MKISSALTYGLAALLALLPVSASAMPPAEAWEIGPNVRGRNYSVGMPATPRQERGGAVSFEFPRAGSGQIDALTTGVGPLEGARAITLRYRIDAARGTRFIADETPDQAATVSLYFQQQGDTWSGRGRYAGYRWYVPMRGVIPLTPGEHSVTIGLDDVWTNVNGQPSNVRGSGFAEALRDTATIGIAFGSAARRSHGVYATGPARFTLLDLDIR